MTLQLKIDQESSACETDFPPGFDVAQEEGKHKLDNSQQLPLTCFSPSDGGRLSENILITGSIEDETLEAVLNNLHLSVNASLFQYFTSILDEEVDRVIVAQVDASFSQVIVD